jgi:subtilisin family serine protease
VVAVTAIDRNERVYTRANQGDYIGFAAPGVELWTAASISGGRLRSGTSYAAPFVTAALAARRAEHPGEPLEKSLRVLEASAVDLGPEGPDPIFGNGLVRASFVCSG